MISVLFIALIINTVLLINQIKQNNKLNKKLVEQIDLTLDALNQSKKNLADNIELLNIIDNSSTKEEMIQKYSLNQSLKK